MAATVIENYGKFYDKIHFPFSLHNERAQFQMSDLGVEEGCPAEEPADLDAIIARPVKRPQPVAAPT